MQGLSSSGVAAIPAIGETLSNLSDRCAVDASIEGVHGGTQSRICRTAHGTYLAFLGKTPGNDTVIHLVRIRDGLPERLASIPSFLSEANSVHVVCDADQEVFLLAPGCECVNGQQWAILSAIHVDRATGATTEHVARVPFGHGNGYGYGSAFIDPSGRAFYALYSGGDAPGYFAWIRFDPANRQWADRATVAELAYRHCYNYGFTDGAGGAVIISERDIRIETAGISPTDPGRGGDARYVWDELRLFRIPDLTRAGYSTVDVEAAVYDKPNGLYPTVQNNHGGDAFLDHAGTMHVLYRTTDNNGIKGSFNRQAVLNPRRGGVFFNARLPFREANAMRMVQSAAGRHYIIAMPYGEPARVRVWAAANPEGTAFDLVADERLGVDVHPSYAGLGVSAPRNGSIGDDVVDAFFPSGLSFYHFRIRLK